MNKRDIGSWYETLACIYLKEQNIKILKRNFRVRSGEIDIVAFDGKYYCFIEVKYRKNTKYGGPEAAVTLSKQKQICNVSRFYLAFNQISESAPIRYDVIAISGEEGASTIKWYKDAFQYML
ncbi:MAG: YraN family protein [Butyrivibrio sp.]|uniref:YraN family protein n=1 Tax=Butyrivibrio sp. TaxID=28121 RepID=UPI001B084809|nr:YraN family protein [Butyrivibrio sp.]MBO6239931.1 YraN family protein [Butyrivibrio sp.]